MKKDLDNPRCRDHRERYCNCSLKLPALTLDYGTKALNLLVTEGHDLDVLDYLLSAVHKLSRESHLTCLEIRARFSIEHQNLRESPPTSLAILDSVVRLGKLQSLQLQFPLSQSDYQNIIAHLPDLR
jgi:hypothetical protein